MPFAPLVAPKTTDLHSMENFRLGRRLESLSEDELEILARAYADGIRTRPQARKLAKALGVPESEVAWWKGNQKIGRKVADILETKAIHGIAEILPHVIKEAKTNPAMFTALLRFSKLISSGGPMVQVNVGNTRGGQEPEQIVAFINTFRERQKEGLLRRLGPVEADAEIVDQTG